MPNSKEDKKIKEKDASLEHTVMVDTKESVEINNSELEDRINKLYGLSVKEEEPQREYDAKELTEVRKKLILLLMIVVVFGFVVIILLIKPFNFNKDNTPNSKDDNDVVEKEESNDELLGEMDFSNDLVIDLNSRITFSSNDFRNIDLFSLYSNDVLESKDIPSDIKLYLLKKTDNFYNLLLDKKINEYVQTCSSEGAIIPKEDFDKMVAKVFGPNVTVEYKDINYLYSDSTDIVKKITLTFSDNQYVVRCNDYIEGNTITKYVQQDLNKAVKNEGSIELYQNVVFINQSGVYKDPNFAELITNDRSAKFEEYINEGAKYKYTFIENDSNYYLSKIEKIKETN